MGNAQYVRERTRQMADDFDVIVIGAGPGGATIAALCAKAGLRVLLAEKNDQAGGKALTVRRKGAGYEMWPVIGIPAGPSRYDELLAKLGLTDEVPVSLPSEEARATGGIVYHGNDGLWRRMAGGGEAPGKTPPNQPAPIRL